LAHAGEKRKARLDYDVGADITGCPSEAEIKNAVGARLGYEPFDDAAPETIAATIARTADVLEARIAVRDAKGKLTGSRSIRSPGRDCAELSEAMTLAISIAIDPLSIARPPPAPAPPAPPPQPSAEPTTCAPCPAPVKPEPCPPPPDPDDAVFFRASAGALMAFGVAPLPITAGFTADAGLRWRALSVDVEGRADIPVSAEKEPAVVASHILVASLVPCGHYSLLAACGVVSLGVLRGSTPDLGGRDSTFYAAAGARVAAEIPLYGSSSLQALALRVHADLQAPLTRTTLYVQGVEAWQTPPLHGALGLALMGEFR
jgi:hypothetical protein